MITLHDLLNNLTENNDCDFTAQGYYNDLTTAEISYLHNYMLNFEFNDANTLKAIADLTFSLFRFKNCDYMTLWHDFDYCNMTLKNIPIDYSNALQGDSYIIAYHLDNDDIRYYAFTI